MTDHTPRLHLPWLMPAQAQKHVTVNEALARLDILVQAAVLSRTLGEQPAAPFEGDGYVLPEEASGADWTEAPAGTLMVFHEGVWRPISPWPGLSVYVRDEGVSLIHDETDWRPVSAQIRSLNALESLGVGVEADSYNRLSIKSPGVLMSAEDGGSGDMRLVMNKSASGATSSLLFQSGWSGRAEIGLAGEEALSVKVSGDGAVWREALSVDPVDAAIRVAGLSVQSDHVRIASSLTPSHAAAAGEAGQICWDGGHVYVCVAQDQWRRAALAAW